VTHPPERPARSAIPGPLAFAIQAGILDYRYKGVRAYKCPFDLAIYAELLWDLKPRTILEFGSNEGGSALWFADTLTAFGLTDTQFYTLDHIFMHTYTDPRVNYVHCDISDIDAHLSQDFIKTWQHPILMIDDASHQYRHSLNILRFFDRVTQPGDYMIVEDGSASIMDAEPQYEGGPHRAIYEFMLERGTDYEIDRARCDRYGHNVTWNTDGYIRRISR
jgi:cephalosporin hydroxylase